MFSADLGVNQVAATPAATDPPFQKVALLLHGDGTNGAQNNTFVDSSSNAFTVTRTGNVAQGTFSPFSLAEGQWSNYFDGTGDYLTVTDSSAFAPGTGAFTWECWFYPTDVWAQVAGGGDCLWYSSAINGIQIGRTNTGTGNAWGIASRGTAWRLTTTTLPNVNQWNHMVVVRSGTGTNETAIFLNGVRVANGTVTASFGNSTGALEIGRGGSGYESTGYLSNVRFVNGSAVYDPTQSTLTVPTAPLTAVSGTSLLTCQSNRFIDNSSNNFTITRNGDTKVTDFSPFAPSAAYSASTNGGSGYFDGSGDWLDAPSSSQFVHGTADFTLEAWTYLTALPALNNNFTIIDQRGGGIFSNIAPCLSWRNVSGTLNVFVESGSTILATIPTTVTIGQWAHVALVRNSSTGYVYVNGVQVGSSFAWTNNYTGQYGVRVGGYSSGFTTLTGYLTNARIVKGTAVYTSNFTPPTAPLTAVSGTQLLLNCTNAGIIDNAGKNDIETVGDAQISTSVKKYGTGSMYFDGTGDWLLLADRPELQLGTENFTVEGWLYLGVTGAARGIVGKGTSTTGWLLSTNSSNQVVFTYASSTITSTGTLSGSTWYHIAVCREGTGTNQTKIYINGSNDGTGTVNTNFNQTNVMYVGANRIGGDAMNGYIDDLRITKGQALYTSNFTPPTQAFPNV